MKFTKGKKIILGVIIFLMLGWFLSVGSSNNQQLITVERSIIIDAEKEVVLSYVQDVTKDPTWRAEVDRMEPIYSEKYGSGAMEYSTFKDKKLLTPAYITEHTDSKIVFTTPDDAKYYLTSIREVEDYGNGKTNLTYTLIYDNNMTAEISPVRIPKPLTQLGYGLTVEKYLNVLKGILEEDTSDL